MSNNLPEIPKHLADALQHRPSSVVVFLGSGVSQGVTRDSGVAFPSWIGLLEELVDWAIDRGFSFTPDQQASLNSLLKSGDPQALLRAGGWLRKTVGNPLFHRFITDTLQTPSQFDSNLHKQLALLPVSGYVTLNYDQLLEASLGQRDYSVATQHDEAKLSDIARNLGNHSFVLKTHGDMERSETIVIGHEDYRKLLTGNKAYRAVISSVFQQSTVLAVGCGMTDPDLDHLLDNIIASFSISPLEVFALLPKGSVDSITQELWLQERQVRVLEYVPSDPTHPEVAQFIEQLVNLTSIPVGTAKGLSPVDDAETADFVRGLRLKLKTMDKSLRTQFEQSGNVDDIAIRRSSIADELIRSCLFFLSQSEDIDVEKFEVIARGGYGRSRLSPGSDIDITILHEESERNMAGLFVRPFICLLIDAWNALSVSVGPICNTLDECCDHWFDQMHRGESPSSLFSFASSRLITGFGPLHVRLRESWIAFVTREDLGQTLSLLKRRLSLPPVRSGDAVIDLKHCPGGLIEIAICDCLREIVRIRYKEALDGVSTAELDNARTFYSHLREVNVPGQTNHVVLQEELGPISEKLEQYGLLKANEIHSELDHNLDIVRKQLQQGLIAAEALIK